jgi:hypothetical protein
MITLEEALFIPETTLKQALTTPHPPTKIDIIIDLYEERARLKEIREQVANGEREPDKKLTAEMYITQLVIATDKTMIDALKETNITLTQNNYVDISSQVNDLIQFSRERQCNKQKLTGPS